MRIAPATSSLQLRWPGLVLTVLLSALVGSVNGNEGHVLVPYEESPESYVDYPSDNASQTLLQSQQIEAPVSLQLWTTADDLMQPLFYLVKGIVRRLDKELLVFTPNYLLDNGRDVGCRVTDPVTGQQVENPDCRQNCSNHGRYCAADSRPEDPALAAKVTGADIVEETLRRLCVWVVYGKTGSRNQLHFWKYINDIGFAQCDRPFHKECTYPIMNRIGVGTHFIERCMNHTHGLDADLDNPYLQSQLNQGRELTLTQIPILKINQYWYTEAGGPSTGRIFRAICANYPADRQPVACDFCKDCNDVRYCLWFLQCDGTNFANYAKAKLNGGAGAQQAQLPSPTTTTTTSTENPNPPPENVSSPKPTRPPSSSAGPSNTQQQTNAAESNNNNDDNNNKEAHARAKDALLHGILVGLAMSVIVSAYFACRDWQAQLVWKEILKEGVNTTKNVQYDDTFQAPRRRKTVSPPPPQRPSSRLTLRQHVQPENHVELELAQQQLDRYQEELQNSFSPTDDIELDGSGGGGGAVDPDDLLYEFSECSTRIITDARHHQAQHHHHPPPQVMMQQQTQPPPQPAFSTPPKPTLAQARTPQPTPTRQSNGAQAITDVSERTTTKPHSTLDVSERSGPIDYLELAKQQLPHVMVETSERGGYWM